MTEIVQVLNTGAQFLAQQADILLMMFITGIVGALVRISLKNTSLKTQAVPIALIFTALFFYIIYTTPSQYEVVKIANSLMFVAILVGLFFAIILGGWAQSSLKWLAMGIFMGFIGVYMLSLGASLNLIGGVCIFMAFLFVIDWLAKYASED